MELGNAIFGNSRGKFEVNRMYQNKFVHFLTTIGFDSYGNINIEVPKKDLGFTTKSPYEFDNDTFAIMPYYWGDNEDILNLPNFIYKPKNFELCWYKYPLRDSYSNIEVDEDFLNEIIARCTHSLSEEWLLCALSYNKTNKTLSCNDAIKKIKKNAIYGISRSTE